MVPLFLFVLTFLDIVNQEKETVTEWTIIFHVQEVANEAFLRGIPKESQLREWNVPIIFGRGKDVNILLNDERASRHHLELNGQLSINGQANFTIRNLSSSKGFIVNGQTITSRNQWNIVKTGDKITVASLSFELEIIPGENTQNFVLEFVHPQERNQNVEASVKNPSAVVFMPPMGPVSPGFMGGIAVPGAFQGAAGVHMGGLPMGGRIPVHGGIPASPVPMGTLPSNGGIPVTGYMPTGHIPGQQFTYMHYPPPPGQFVNNSSILGYGGGPDREPIVNLMDPPKRVSPSLHHPVQEVDSQPVKRDQKAVTKQPSESNEDSLSETTGKPLQDTQAPKDVD